jgi:hypothetical protein
MEKFRIILDKIQTCIELQCGATESQLKSIWNDLSDAITECESNLANSKPANCDIPDISNCPAWLDNEDFEFAKMLFKDNKLQGVKYLYELAKPHTQNPLSWAKTFLEGRQKAQSKDGQLNIPDVSNRRELLLAFSKFAMLNNYTDLALNNIIDQFIEESKYARGI